MPSFYNAKDGITKVFAAQILLIISSVVSYSDVFINYDNINMESKLTMFLLTIMMLFTSVFSVLAFVLNVMGLKIAGKDDKRFTIAFYFSIVLLVLTSFDTVSNLLIINGVITSNTVIAAINSTIEIVKDILIMIEIILVCLGLCNLLNQRNETKTAKSGKTIIVMYLISLVITIFIQIFSLIMKNNNYMEEIKNQNFNDTTIIIGVVFVLALLIVMVITLIAEIKYLVFLGKAKNRLA